MTGEPDETGLCESSFFRERARALSEEDPYTETREPIRVFEFFGMAWRCTVCCIAYPSQR